MLNHGAIVLFMLSLVALGARVIGSAPKIGMVVRSPAPVVWVVAPGVGSGGTEHLSKQSSIHGPHEPLRGKAHIRLILIGVSKHVHWCLFVLHVCITIMIEAMCKFGEHIWQALLSSLLTKIFSYSVAVLCKDTN